MRERIVMWTTGESRARPTMTLLASTLLYAIAWAAPRWPAIRANTLFYDDYGLARVPFFVYVGSYRPTLYLEYRVWEWLVPGHFHTRIPKLSAAGYWGLSCTALVLILRRWRVPIPLALSIPLLLVLHPVATECGLWSALSALPLAFFFVLAGMLALDDASDRRRIVAGSLLILLGIFGYQYYFLAAVVVAMTDALLEEVHGERLRWRKHVGKLALLAGLAAIQIATMQLIKASLSHSDVRGLARLSGDFGAFLLLKWHGAVDLLVNVWMPVVAWYLGAERAWSLWRAVPLAVALLTLTAGFAVRARPRAVLLAAAASGLLPLAAVLPTFALSQSAYSWRVDVPVLLAALLGMLPLLLWLQEKSRIAPALVILALAAVVVPVTRWEADMRVEGYTIQRELFDRIGAHWHGQRPSEIGVGVGRIGPDAPQRRPFDSPREVTVGYDRINPARSSPFLDPWLAEQAISTFHHYRFIDCISAGSGSAPLCQAAHAACLAVPPDRLDVVHDDKARISFICERVAEGTVR